MQTMAECAPSQGNTVRKAGQHDPPENLNSSWSNLVTATSSSLFCGSVVRSLIRPSKRKHDSIVLMMQW